MHTCQHVPDLVTHYGSFLMPRKQALCGGQCAAGQWPQFNFQYISGILKLKPMAMIAGISLRLCRNERRFSASCSASL